MHISRCTRTPEGGPHRSLPRPRRGAKTLRPSTSQAASGDWRSCRAQRAPSEELAMAAEQSRYLSWALFPGSGMCTHKNVCVKYIYIYMAHVTLGCVYCYNRQDSKYGFQDAALASCPSVGTVGGLGPRLSYCFLFMWGQKHPYGPLLVLHIVYDRYARIPDYGSVRGTWVPFQGHARTAS